MEILNENQTDFVDMEVEMSNDEFNKLVKYFDNNCSQSDQNNIKINWAVNEILRKMIKDK